MNDDDDKRYLINNIVRYSRTCSPSVDSETLYKMDGKKPSSRKVILFLLVTLLLIGAASARLDRTAIPYHYDVELTINLDTRKFYVEETIEFTLLEDTNRLTMNVFNLESSWVNSVLKPVDEEDVQYSPFTSAVHLSDRDQLLILQFMVELPGNTNYTLKFDRITGSFGSGFVEWPMTVGDAYLLTTGLDNTNFRSVFPCFDEPEFKATFDFTVFHPSEFHLLHNFAENSIVGPIAERSNYIRTEFKGLIPLATSSIAFVLTTMKLSKTTNNRIGLYSLHDDESYQVYQILNDFFSKILENFETSLNSRLANPKLDIVYVPNLKQKTITKFGFVFIDETLFQVENTADYAQTVKENFAIAANAVMQIYYGHMVTQDWWNSLWIVKGLARYMSSLISDNELFVENTIQVALNGGGGSSLDSSFTTIEAINNPDLTVFDQKAGVLMRMAASIIGETSFKSAATDFFALYQNLSVTSVEFFFHLEGYATDAILPPSTTLLTVLKSWMSYRGYPILKVSRKNSGEIAILHVTPAERIDIPVDYSTTTSAASQRPKLWIIPSTEEAVIETTSPWIYLNPGQFGLYRVKYDEDLWDALLDQLAKDHSLFSNLNRAHLLDESSGLAVSLEAPYSQHLNLTKYLVKETDDFVWSTAARIFEDWFTRFGIINERTRFLYHYNHMANTTYLANRINSGNFETALQVGRIACLAGNQQCVADAEKYFDDTIQNGVAISGPENFKYLIYCTLARYLDNAGTLVTGLVTTLVDEVDIESVTVVLRGLGCSNDLTLLNTLYSYVGSRQLELLGIFLTPAQKTTMFRALLHGGYNSTKQGLQYTLENYITLSSLIPNLENVLVDISDQIYSLELYNILSEIRSTHSIRMTPEVQILIGRELGLSSENVNWLGIHQVEVNQWLRENVQLPGAATAIKSFSSLLIFFAVCLLKYVL